MQSHDDLLTSRTVRQRYGGVSDMSLWRWLRDPDLQFPQPLIINSRRYWRLAELAAWESRQPSKKEVA